MHPSDQSTLTARTRKSFCRQLLRDRDFPLRQRQRQRHHRPHATPRHEKERERDCRVRYDAKCQLTTTRLGGSRQSVIVHAPSPSFAVSVCPPPPSPSQQQQQTRLFLFLSLSLPVCRLLVSFFFCTRRFRLSFKKVSLLIPPLPPSHSLQYTHKKRGRIEKERETCPVVCRRGCFGVTTGSQLSRRVAIRLAW